MPKWEREWIGTMTARHNEMDLFIIRTRASSILFHNLTVNNGTEIRLGKNNKLLAQKRAKDEILKGYTKFDRQFFGVIHCPSQIEQRRLFGGDAK